MKIAIVDDDLKWCEKIKEEIGRCEQGNEATIDFFSCGEDYLASEELYDISFVDIEMPGVDGFETIAKMKKRNADGIYIILTRHNEMSRIG